MDRDALLAQIDALQAGLDALRAMVLGQDGAADPGSSLQTPFAPDDEALGAIFDPEEWLAPKQAAHLARCSERTLLRATMRGDVESRCMLKGRARYYRRASLIAFRVLRPADKPAQAAE